MARSAPIGRMMVQPGMFAAAAWRIVAVVPTDADLPLPPLRRGALAVVLTPLPTQGRLWAGNMWESIGPLASIPGPPGPSNVLTVGTVTTDTTPAVTVTAMSPSQTVNFVFPGA